MNSQPTTLVVDNNKTSVIGGALFIAGSSIGIGVLSLPTPLGLLGLIPSFFVFVFSFLVMLSSAFILIELYNAEKEDVNLFTLSKKFLGEKAAFFLRIIYTLLFTAFIFAYLNKGGELLSYSIPNVGVSTLLLAILGIASVLVSKNVLDHSNRFSVIVMFVAYAFLIFFNISNKKGDLSHVDLSFLMTSIPFVVVTFGYHNMIPSIRKRFDITGQNLKKICIIGGLLTFVVYFTWVIKVVMTLPVNGAGGIAEAYATQKLSSESLLQVVSSPYFFYAIQVFSLLAIFTSLVGQSVSLTDFLLDSFRKRGTINEKLTISSLVTLVSLIFIYLYPKLFYTVLELCGGILAILIFCVYPSIIYLKARSLHVLNKKYFPLAIIVLICSCCIIGYEICKHFIAL